jgi:hypothetical protein
MDETNLDLELLTSSLQADHRDVRILLKVLVENLSDALGGRLEVERAGGRLLKRSNEVAKMTIKLGDDQFDAIVEGDRLACAVAHSSGGIRIRSERVSMEEWLRRLLVALKQEAATSQATREALESMMIGDQS